MNGTKGKNKINAYRCRLYSNPQYTIYHSNIVGTSKQLRMDIISKLVHSLHVYTIMRSLTISSKIFIPTKRFKGPKTTIIHQIPKFSLYLLIDSPIILGTI